MAIEAILRALFVCCYSTIWLLDIYRISRPSEAAAAQQLQLSGKQKQR